MNTRNMLANAMWLIIVVAALTVPFWGHWMFAVGVLVMAIAYELREVPSAGGRMVRTGMVGTRGTGPVVSVRRQRDSSRP